MRDEVRAYTEESPLRLIFIIFSWLAKSSSLYLFSETFRMSVALGRSVIIKYEIYTFAEIQTPGMRLMNKVVQARQSVVESNQVNQDF